ncbi:MAG: LysE family transporter [Rhodospirillaceae bacterium]
MEHIAYGALVGLALAAPVGPVGILCIRLALTQGRLPAVIAGLGAATADTAFGAVAGLGLIFVQTFVSEHHVILSGVGALIVIALGLATLRKTVAFEERLTTLATLSQDFATTFTLAITNPATMIAALGLFAALGPIDISDDISDQSTVGPLLVLGVFFGSAAWWLFLASCAVLLRRRLLDNFNWLNRISGGLLLLFGAVLIVRLLTSGT